MKAGLVLTAVIVIAVVAVGTFPGCGGGTEPTGMTQSLAEPTQVTNTALTTVVNPEVTTEAVPSLNIWLSASLNGTGVIKATTITKAELLNSARVRVALATIVGAKASFPMTGLTSGQYFIRINGLNSDLVPTRIGNPTLSQNQFVSTTLRNTVIGALTNPTIKMTTFALGQSQHPVVAYTTGASETRYAYGVFYYKSVPQKFEVRVLGKGNVLSTLAAGGHHSMATWVMGSGSHGTSTSGCAGCHGTLTTKRTPYTSISTGNGWCYKCHYGPTGAQAGMVDPAS